MWRKDAEWLIIDEIESMVFKNDNKNRDSVDTLTYHEILSKFSVKYFISMFLLFTKALLVN